MGAISVTWFVLASTEAQIGSRALWHAKARGAAQGALTVALRGWRPGLTPVAAGDSLALSQESFSSGVVGWSSVVGLGGPILALVATGESRDAAGRLLGRARMQLLVRLDSLGPDSVVRPHPIARAWRPIP